MTLSWNVVFEHTDEDGDTLRVYDNGAAEVSYTSPPKWYGPLREDRTNYNFVYNLSLVAVFDTGLRLRGRRGGGFILAAPTYESGEELLRAMEDALAGGGEGEEVEDAYYYERKADAGKPRMSLIPYELMKVRGSCPPFLERMLEGFQTGDPEKELDGLRRHAADMLTEQLQDVAAVLVFGAEKYSENSWRDVPDGVARYRDALFRHQYALDAGETLDPESGLPHSAHRDCCALFLLALLCGR